MHDMSPPPGQVPILVARVAAGDQVAVAGLLERYRGRLSRMVALRLDPRLQGRVGCHAGGRRNVNGSRHRMVSRDPCRRRGATRLPLPSAGPGGTSTAVTYFIALHGRTEHEQTENALLPARRVTAP